MRIAAILSIGDELALGQSLDTNSAWIAGELASAGIVVDEHRTVSDERIAIGRAINELSRDRHLLIVTGGLGPTIDDMTREALGDVLTPDEALVQDEQAMDWLNEWFGGRGRSMPESNTRQTYRPSAMRCLHNPHGTAPGLAGRHGTCAVFALPGPPPEMKPMFRNHVLPALAEWRASSKESVVTGKVNLFGIGESLAAERIADLMPRDREPLVGITVSGAVISARIRATGAPTAVEPRVASNVEEIERRWYPYCYGRRDETLAQALGRLLKEKQATLATAESCTGGWLGKSIVDVAGSSAYYLGGWVTYSNQMKTQCLGVDAELIEAKGAVSHEVAQAMALGAQRRAGSDYAVAITGIAGPNGSAEKSVGLVYIAHAKPDETVAIRRFNFSGDRTEIRERSVLAAMQMVRFAILGVSDETQLLWQSVQEATAQGGRT